LDNLSVYLSQYKATGNKIRNQVPIYVEALGDIEGDLEVLGDKLNDTDGD